MRLSPPQSASVFSLSPPSPQRRFDPACAFNSWIGHLPTALGKAFPEIGHGSLHSARYDLLLALTSADKALRRQVAQVISEHHQSITRRRSVDPDHVKPAVRHS